ncbi:MAG: hypothetical protein KC493_07460 [Bacteriovoracaceae bacterium]|nr:hypothetical protein [Bacteriovoracaceae bacterium]
MNVLKYFVLLILLSSCASTYKNKGPLNQAFPNVKGKSLEGDQWEIPQGFKGKKTVLLIGYKQDSQFDIDRWLIGLDMKEFKGAVYELPTIQGLFPRMFSTKIDDGMRRGIPKELWKGVITIYKDGDRIQKFTGNEKPNNSRVILLDADGVIRYFNDSGFSVKGLNLLIDKYNNKKER